jgi:PAS domain-containing protein
MLVVNPHLAMGATLSHLETRQLPREGATNAWFALVVHPSFIATARKSTYILSSIRLGILRPRKEEAQAYSWNARRPLNSYRYERPGGTDITERKQAEEALRRSEERRSQLQVFQLAAFGADARWIRAY